MFIHLPDVLAPGELAELRRLLDTAPWADGRETAGTQAAQAKRNRQVAAGSAELVAMQQRVLAALGRHAGFFSAALPRYILPPQFNRYAGDTNHYADHVDQAIRYLPSHGQPGGQPMRTDLSCTLFLSDPREYEGGELVAQGPGGEHRAKGAAGSAVLYPGHTVHRVEPVTRGQRLASFFWVQSLVRSHEQRHLLCQMDQALMSLRSHHGEDPATVALTGTYHHLLRLWSDT